MGEAYEIKEDKEWERTRYIVYIQMLSARAMDGKPYFKNIKKPTDVFPVSQDNKRVVGKKVVIDRDKQAKAVERHKKMMAKNK